MSKNNQTILDDIRHYSNPGFKDETKSIVDVVLDSNWITEDDLVCAHGLMNDIEERGGFAVTFFQLPFVMKLPLKWIHLKDGNADYPLMNCRAFKCHPQTDSMVLEKHGRTPGQVKHISLMRSHRNSLFFDAKEGTQVLLSVPLRSRLRQNFISYCKAVRDEQSRMSVIANSPTGRRSITVAEYEHTLIKEVKVTAHNAINKFIESYSIVARDPYAIQVQHLKCFFTMVVAGRLILPLPDKATAEEIILNPQDDENFKKKKEIEDKRVKEICNKVILDIHNNRQYSRYEKYLLEARRQILLGRNELAVVQAVMILEWFANEIIRSYLPKSIDSAFRDSQYPELHSFLTKKILHSKSQKEPSEDDYLRWVKLEEKLGDYFEGIGINIKANKENLWQLLRKIIEERNKIVHQRHGNFSINKSDASIIVEDTFRIIGFCLSELKKKYTS